MAAGERGHALWQVGAGGSRAIDNLEELERVLLHQRQVDWGQRQSFFSPTIQRDAHDPLALYGMEAAVERLQRAVSAGERILVWGDYDTDGICATAILVSVLRQLGAQVTPYLPDRADGYGLNGDVLRHLRSDFDLLVTVDCGVSDGEEILWLKSQGIDVIVVDHHAIPEQLPPALAVLHPRHPEGAYDCPHLSGAGVSWKLAQGLLRHPQSGVANAREAELWLLDLATLGTVGDMVPLLGENRAIVTDGLHVLRHTRRVGLQQLVQAQRRSSDFDTEHISWRLVPLLNAAGRMDHPLPALELLLTNDEARAAELLTQLQRYQQERRKVSARVLAEATAQCEERDDACIFVASEQWPAGVVGLVASRLSEAFDRPAFVVGHNGKHAVGSVRSRGSANVLELMHAGKKYLTASGGHPQAAGFSLPFDQVPALRQAIVSAGETVRPPATMVQADAVVAEELLTSNTVTLTRKFAPFGAANAKPQFVSRNLRLVSARAIGKSGQHAKFSFDANGSLLDGIGFGLADTLQRLKSAVDVFGALEFNQYRGRTMLQLQVQAIVPAGAARIVEGAPISV